MKTDAPMDEDEIAFASMLCSRLCHDLMSPIGAFNNGLELLADEEDPALRAQYLELLADSARASTTKLKFFRLAFGSSGNADDPIASQDACAAVEGLVRGNSKVALGWLVDAPQLSRVATRILLNMALIALDGLVRGGRLDVGVEGDEIVVRADGPRVVLDAGIRSILSGEPAPVQPRTIGAALIRTLAAQEGRRLLVNEDGGVLLMGASAPATVGR